jgi:lauroyl/myristoyl acyltransferase
MGEKILYLFASGLIRFLQALPVRTVARLGRFGGGLAYTLDARHRKVALRNLQSCFGNEKSAEEIRQLARENFKRIGESYACGIKTAGMPFSELQQHVDFVGAEHIIPSQGETELPSQVVAIGHFGNFELYARFGQFTRVFQCITTYRGLPQPSLNRLLQSLREQSGCLFFERRTDGSALKAAMNGPGKMLGLLCDQHAGDNGLRLPFFGRDCSTSSAPAIFALRYRCRLFTGFCYRTALGKWRLEAGPEIPTSENGEARSTAAIMLDVNKAFEDAVRRDPANWFWVHNRWKLAPPKAAAAPRTDEPALSP